MKRANVSPRLKLDTPLLEGVARGRTAKLLSWLAGSWVAVCILALIVLPLALFFVGLFSG